MRACRVIIPLLCTLLTVFKTNATTDCAKEGSSRSPSLKIKNKILCNYDKEYRPVKSQNKVINVTFRLALKYLDSVSEESSEMEIQSWVGFIWKDEFLVWNPADFDFVRNIHIPCTEIWTPDIQQFKDQRTPGSVFGESDCLVQSDGIVRSVVDSQHDADCETNIHKWPYDTATCELVFTTGIHNYTQVKFTPRDKKLILSGFQQSPEWELTNTSYTLKLHTKASQRYQRLTYFFTVKRHSTRTTAIILVPAMSLITMTLAPLWMQPESTERFCLIAANLLSHFLFVQHLGWMTPQLGVQLPPAVTFFRDSLGLAIIVLIELTFVKSLLSNRIASPTWVLIPCRLVNRVIGKTIPNENLQEINDEENSSQTDNKEFQAPKAQGERYLIVGVIDKILFFILAIVYFILVIKLIPFN